MVILLSVIALLAVSISIDPLCRVFDSAHQVFTIHIVYYYLVTNYGDPAALHSVWYVPFRTCIVSKTHYVCFVGQFLYVIIV